MNKNVIIVLSALMTFTLCVQGCVVPTNPPLASEPDSSPAPTMPEAQPTPSGRIPSPPKIPQEVLSIWNRQPPSESTPADLAGELFLKPNPDTSEGEGTEGGNTSDDGLSVGYVVVHTPWQDTARFQLNEDQWVDVIFSSLDVPVYCLIEEPGAVSFQLQRIHEEDGKQGRSGMTQAARPVGTPEDEQFKAITFAVYNGKRLYENHVTNTQEGTLFTSAYRLFACAGAGDYVLNFSNFNRQQGAEITYRVCRLGTTPNWGETYSATSLQPWFDELYEMLISGKVSQEEYREAEAEWLRQLMD